MPFISNADMNTNVPDDKEQEGDRFIRKLKKRRFWFHFSMLWIACIAFWLVVPPLFEKFRESGNDFHPFVAVFSNSRSTVGFISMFIITSASVLYDLRFWRNIREYEASTNRKPLSWFRLWW